MLKFIFSRDCFDLDSGSVHTVIWFASQLFKTEIVNFFLQANTCGPGWPTGLEKITATPVYYLSRERLTNRKPGYLKLHKVA